MTLLSNHGVKCSPFFLETRSKRKVLISVFVFSTEKTKKRKKSKPFNIITKMFHILTKIFDMTKNL